MSGPPLCPGSLQVAENWRACLRCPFSGHKPKTAVPTVSSGTWHSLLVVPPPTHTPPCCAAGFFVCKLKKMSNAAKRDPGEEGEESESESDSDAEQVWHESC